MGMNEPPPVTASPAPFSRSCRVADAITVTGSPLGVPSSPRARARRPTAVKASWLRWVWVRISVRARPPGATVGAGLVVGATGLVVGIVDSGGGFFGQDRLPVRAGLGIQAPAD